MDMNPLVSARSLEGGFGGRLTLEGQPFSDGGEGSDVQRRQWSGGQGTLPASASFRAIACVFQRDAHLSLSLHLLSLLPGGHTVQAGRTWIKPPAEKVGAVEAGRGCILGVFLQRQPRQELHKWDLRSEEGVDRHVPCTAKGVLQYLVRARHWLASPFLPSRYGATSEPKGTR